VRRQLGASGNIECLAVPVSEAAAGARLTEIRSHRKRDEMVKEREHRRMCVARARGDRFGPGPGVTGPSATQPRTTPPHAGAPYAQL
jgi:hypothetical protein